jgi:cytochrome o ubiquinol oxidase subunit 2
MFSGDGFSDMHFRLRAVPAAEFAAWAATTRAAGPTLDLSTYSQLARQSRNVRPFTYRAVQPELFQAILVRRAPPGPGPNAGRGGPEVSPVSNKGSS